METGLVLVGGFGPGATTELWTPNGSCILPPLPLEMNNHPTLDLVYGTLVTCYLTTCYSLVNPVDSRRDSNSRAVIDDKSEWGWEAWTDTLHTRAFHTSAFTGEGILLIGGVWSSETTEVITLEEGHREGSPLVPGRQYHCSIQLTASRLVVIGGQEAEDQVTEYFNLDSPDQVELNQLPSLITGRFAHACGSYLVANTMMLIVTGGNNGVERLASTEVMEYSAAGEGRTWREVEALPSPRSYANGAKLGGIFHLTGGYDGEAIDAVLAWDPVDEKWLNAGNLSVARYYHDSVEVLLESEPITLFCTKQTENVLSF